MSNTDFYTVLAHHYDELFAPSDAGIGFLKDEADRAHVDDAEGPHRPRAIDVACGTGAWLRRLVALDVDVVGIDLSEAMMNRGRTIAGKRGVDPDRLRVADMMAVDTHSRAPFDLVYCIGNSISHLGSFSDVERFISAARGALRDTGTLVLQYVSVDTLPVGERFALPALEADGVAFERTYSRTSQDAIEFSATLRVTDEAPRSISQRLLILEDDRMTRALTKAGFGSVDVYGGFDRSKPDETGWVRVVRAARS
jgi:SAM-dependent methyltransferase